MMVQCTRMMSPLLKTWRGNRKQKEIGFRSCKTEDKTYFVLHFKDYRLIAVKQKTMLLNVVASNICVHVFLYVCVFCQEGGWIEAKVYFVLVGPVNTKLMNTSSSTPVIQYTGNVLSWISEGQNHAHAFSSAAPGQGSDTHFNTSESPYTTDREEAVMHIPEQPLLERGWEDVVLRRQLKRFNEKLDTCLKNLLERIKRGSVDRQFSAMTKKNT